MSRKSNWIKIKKQKIEETARNRNVYENQQLERSKIEEKQSMTTRTIGTIFLTIIVFLVVYVLVSSIRFGIAYYIYFNASNSSNTVWTSGDASDITIEDDTLTMEKLYESSGVEVPEKYKTHDNNNSKNSDDIQSEESYINMDEFMSSEETDRSQQYEDNTEAQYENNDLQTSEGNMEDLAPQMSDYFLPNMYNVGISFTSSLIFFLAFYQFMQRNLMAQNLMNDTADINQYQDDQHIALPEEVQLRYDWFPDVGAHSKVQVSSMISHMALNNKGLNKIMVPQRADADIIDKDGEVQYYKGEILRDEKGKPIYEKVPMIDEDFTDELFEASEALDTYQIAYDARKIEYNPDSKYSNKQGGDYDTVADLINHEWVLPEYEPQRPAGAYIVDTEPVNTMLLAITRAGKGQTVIEPTLDMWTRELRPNNIVVNDPKGELLVKFFVRATVRGFQVVQFNLINSMKTDIYNPIGLAAEAAREGDFTKCAQYVENIANVFFPLDGGEDPVWPQAANNAFKRAAYGLIDFYLEEENELRQYAEKVGMDDIVLNNKLDEMWGYVTLYNCYQLFVQMTSKKQKNPATQLINAMKSAVEKADKARMSLMEQAQIAREAGDEEAAKAFENEAQGIVDEYTVMANNEPEKFKKLQNDARDKGIMWDGKPSEDLLTLYFNATDRLPKNGMRTLVSNANNALKSMSGAEKMMASVYGIAISAMSFFTDPTISTLTSGRPSQNVDLSGISFPRRIGVRFHSEFIKKYHLIGTQCVWEAFSDRAFKKNMGKEFHHENIVSREGWAKYYVRGIFPNDTTYIRLQIKNTRTGNLLHEFHFSFVKSYQRTLDGRHYVKDPILDKKIVRDGILTELQSVQKKNSEAIIYKKGKSTFVQRKIKNLSTLKDEDIKQGNIIKEKIDTNIINMMSTRYSEQPKMVFLVTPPHLKQYAKLLLILIKQLVDLNFEQSYMTEKNQKPLYKTRFMLDELGNLESDGHGIQNFSTMLSIGLGQDQQFTIILQTLQQLRDVYGESEDKIVQGNTSNIVFLKSTDDNMIETLVKMSGTTHESYIDQKTITRDMEKIWLKNEGKTSYTMSTREVPVIKSNDLKFIPKSNSIVYRAGDAPIWNRNETILPMSWKLFQNTITAPGKHFSLATIPTLSSAMEFDVRKNQPDFAKMLEKRMAQAMKADRAKAVFQKAYNYDDYELTQLDDDEKSKDIMEIINDWIREEKTAEAKATEEVAPENIDYNSTSKVTSVEVNMEVNAEVQEQVQKSEARKKAIFAGNMIAPADLVADDGHVIGHSFDKDIAAVYEMLLKDMWNDRLNFQTLSDGSLYSAMGELFIEKNDTSNLQEINKAINDPNSNVYGEEQIAEEELSASGRYIITDAFYKWLANLPNWNNIARGRFEREMAKRMQN